MDLRILASVPDGQALRDKLMGTKMGERRNANDLKVATALLRKLLEPDEKKRLKHFNRLTYDRRA